MHNNNTVCAFVSDHVFSCLLPAFQLLTFCLIEFLGYVGHIDYSYYRGKIGHFCLTTCSLFSSPELVTFQNVLNQIDPDT